MSYIPPPTTEEYPDSGLHARLLAALLAKSASVSALSVHLTASEHELYSALDHKHFARIAGTNGWEWTVAGNEAHMASLRENAQAHLHPQPKRGELPHDVTADPAQARLVK